MTVVGITGGIGAGKSVVSRVLRCKGHEVYDCDLEARRLMDGSQELKRVIAARLGESCVFSDGSLNRAEIARIVFSDESNRLWLNARVHSMVRADIDGRLARVSGDTFFIESAILRSSGLDSVCHRIWLVQASDEVRLQRACCRDGADVRSIKARMSAQSNEFVGFGGIPVEIIDNDGIAPLLPQIENQLSKISENA